MATTGGDAVFVDTNVLVYSKQQFSSFHSATVARLEDLDKQGTVLWTSRQVLREYLAVMSRPGGLTTPVPVADLVRDIGEFTASFLLAEDSAGVTQELLQLLTQVTVGGKQVHDANIVATMLAFRIPRLLTNNAGDFARFGNRIIVLPLIP
jgi:predicted nucleic acid-binding protein